MVPSSDDQPHRINLCHRAPSYSAHQRLRLRDRHPDHGVQARARRPETLARTQPNSPAPKRAHRHPIYRRRGTTRTSCLTVISRGCAFFPYTTFDNISNPVTENVTLQIGTFSVTIPSGSFQQNHSGRFTFQGVINGLNLQVQITPLGNNIFTFKAEKFKSEGIGVDLTGLSNPVDVVLTIGNDSGSTAVTAQIRKPKADQQD